MALLAKRSPSAAIEWFDKGGGAKAGGPAAVAGKAQSSAFVFFFSLVFVLALKATPT